ncbi:MAG: ABC transporter substrate-binding protein [Lachnospiraceae bacterium]
MKRCSKKMILLVMLFTLTIALSGCRGDKANESSSEITIGIPQDIEESLDPHKAVAAGTREVLFNVFEGLVKPDSDGNLVEAVASEYTISEDGLVYTFTLRDGIKFHDGSEVTVEDVKFSIDKCADTSNGEPLVSAFSNIEEVKILDSSTVEVILKESNTEFLAYMTTAIVPMSNENVESVAIGTGPYMLVDRSIGENIILKRFDGYWGEPAGIEDITLKVFSSNASVVMEVEGGAVDMVIRISPENANQLSEQFTTLEGNMNLVQALYINNAVEPFNDVRVRQAMSYVIDPDEIMEYLSDGKGKRVGSSMFPEFGKYYMEELNDAYAKNIELAKQLLADAGYADGFEMSITVPSNYEQHVDTAQIIAEQLKAIGINASIQLVEWDSWLSDVYLGRAYQTTVIGVDASSLTARAMLERFTSDSDSNFINYSNETYDLAYSNAQLSVDDDQKTMYYKECLTILSDTAANVYIQDLPEFVSINKKYAGYEFYPLYAQDFSKLYVVE